MLLELWKVQVTQVQIIQLHSGWGKEWLQRKRDQESSEFPGKHLQSLASIQKKEVERKEKIEIVLFCYLETMSRA